MGKTRLAIELCKRMRAAGWRVGFMPKVLGVDRFAELVQSEEPVVAVIDYAESRGQIRELLEVAAARRGEEKSKKKLRLLLLARNADEWWTDLLRSDGAVKDLLCDDPMGLEAVDADREAVFHEAVRGLARELHQRVPESAAPSLADQQYERVLYIHMAALAAVEGGVVKADMLMEDTLDHEERFWREQLRDRGHAGERVAMDKMRRAMAALTLIGGAGSAADAHALVDDEELELLLHDLYPGNATQYMSGLEPDLLGQAMVWRVLSKEGAGAGSYLDRVFDGVTDKAIRTGFGVLGRLSEDHKEADGWIAHMLAHDVAGRAMEAFAAAKSVGEHTAHAGLGLGLVKALEREGTVETAKRLEAELPDAQQTVSLREVGRWVLATRLAHLPEGTHEERARVLSKLSLYQRALGQREAALASAVEAVPLFRRLAEAQLDVFLPDVAGSLDILGGMQDALGQRESALASTLEAVTLYRRLTETRPDTFLPDLARSLSNLSNGQSALGQREAALASILEAVALRRRLAETRPDTLPDLAMSLNNLSLWQSALGQREPALASILEAVAIRRRLADARPDAFLPDLAMSLSNLGNMQSALGQREAALASTLEAEAFHRRLADARPDAFLPDLARSLNNLGVKQSALGQQEAALASTLEAVALDRRLAEERPDRFLPALAMDLGNLGKAQSMLGQREAALASALEAVTLMRRLAEAQPDTFLSDLATSLNNLGIAQSDLGEREAALASAREAVSLGRGLAETQPEAFLPDLARSLNNLAVTLHSLGRIAEALPFAEEALELIWPFYERSPEAHGDLTGSVLRTMATLLKSLGQPTDKRWTQRMTRYLAISGS
jgi:tetratricopeptide (TPR) repeat protein